LNALRKSFSGSSAVRLEAAADAVSSVRNSLAPDATAMMAMANGDLHGSLERCKIPTAIDVGSGWKQSYAYFDSTARQMNSVAVAALASGKRSAVSLMHSHGASEIVHSNIKVDGRSSPANHHTLSHRGEPVAGGQPGEGNWQNHLAVISVYCAELVRDLVDGGLVPLDRFRAVRRVRWQ
jgi:hypothetical protein